MNTLNNNWEAETSAVNISINCISPEERDLLDTVMQEWGKQYADLKNNNPGVEPSYYSFAYWLVRWSGLVQPA